MAKKKMTLEEKLEEAIVKDAPYEVPKNWIWTNLKNVGELVTGNTPSKNNSEFYGSEIAFIKPTDLNQGRNLSIATEYLSLLGGSKARLLPKGSTCVCCIGATIGKVAYLNVEGATNQQINSIIPYKINNLYVYYYTLSNEFNYNLIENSSSTTLPIINKSRMGELTIPIAPLKEQKRIVDKIENLFEKLDKVKELIEEARDDFKKRKSAIVYKIINKFSNEKIKLKDCIIFITDKKEPVDGDVYIGLENMGKSTGIIEYSVAENVKSTKTKFNKGDILYGRLRPYLDKHDVADRSGVCSTDILVMRANEKFEPRYIDYILGTLELIRYANENSSGINLPRVSAKVLGEYKIPKIEFDKQKKVVKILNTIFEHEDKIEELTALEEQIELIKKSILAKAFRGKLGTNCEEDESALELLKEILSKE